MVHDGGEIEEDAVKATAMLAWKALASFFPRTREKLHVHELKLVAVYDARRVGHRDKCMRYESYSPGLTATRPPELRGSAAALMG